MGQDNRVKELETRIKILEETLEEAQTYTYIDETHTIHCRDGEIYFGYGEVDYEQTLVMNVEELYKDLPSIIRMVCKEQKKMQQMHIEMIKEALI